MQGRLSRSANKKRRTPDLISKETNKDLGDWCLKCQPTIAPLTECAIREDIMSREPPVLLYVPASTDEKKKMTNGSG